MPTKRTRTRGREQLELTLGKGSAFVKSRLRRLPQIDDTWEADVQSVPGKRRGQIDFWLGMVVEQEGGGVLATASFDHPPTPNDFAKLLADAMNRPLNEDRQHRPTTILVRHQSTWDELLPHLRELGIQIEVVENLHVWAETQKSGLEWQETLRSLAGDTASKPPVSVEALYPTVGKWVRHGGWIEIGERDGEGFLVRALDEGGLAFEDTKATSLNEALAALETGITHWIEEVGIDLGS